MNTTNKPNLLEIIRQDVIGGSETITTPFGIKPLVYADYTASGRSLNLIEQYIQKEVLPWYANTHSESSYCGRQSTIFREQARDIIRKGLGADETWAIIFCGYGATAAINKFIDLLGLRLPLALSQRSDRQNNISDNVRPVIFLSPYEHHSNELPWRESSAEIVVIPFDQQGQLDLLALENALTIYQHRTVKIGSFSAASNVTGMRTDVDRINALLHQYGALACWDYAAAGPYVNINMQNTATQNDNSIDALYLSPHKFIGGPGTPGILAIKRRFLSDDYAPAQPGGGTVSWVSPQTHRYLAAGERREEGGTPGIVEAIRAGLVFKIKADVGAEVIEQCERQHIQKVISRLKKHSQIHILGNLSADRLAILSLQIKKADQTGVVRDLHYGFVVALLNDLFGIQARGGCSCAGPYGHYLLTINDQQSQAYQQLVLDGHVIFRPGWVRLNFNYFIDAETIDYLLTAIELIATHGWKLLSHYEWCNTNNVWRYRFAPQPVLKNLAEFSLSENQSEIDCASKNMDRSSVNLTTTLHQMTTYLANIEPVSAKPMAIRAEDEALRWFAKAEDFS